MNREMILDLKDHKDIWTYAEKKWLWVGDGGVFNKWEVRDYYKAFDANQLFIKKKMKNVQFVT